MANDSATSQFRVQLAREYAEQVERANQAEKEAEALAKRAVQDMDKRREFAEGRLHALEAEASMLAMNHEEIAKQLDILQQLEEHQGELTELQLTQRDALVEIHDMSGKEREARQKDNAQKIAVMKKFNELSAEGEKNMKEMEAAAEGLTRNFMGLLGMNFNEGIFAQLDNFASKMKEAGLANGFKALAKSTINFQVAHSATNSIMMKFFEATWKAVSAQLDAEASLSGLTGGVQKYNTVLAQSYKAGLGISANMQEQHKSIAALYEGYSEFSSLEANRAAALVTTTTALSRMGMSEAQVAENMTELTKTFGMSTEQAMGFNVELARMGSAIGVNAGKMAKDFQTSAGRMQFFGKNMKRTFKDLATEAKATGTEVSTLVGVAQGFDTFSDAQDKVNKLNQLMGGNYLNSVKMVGMRDEERIKYLKEQIRLSGLLTGSTDHLTKKAIAAVIGQEGLNALLKDSNTTDEEKLKIQRKAAKEAHSRKQLEKLMSAAHRALPLMERLTRAIERAFARTGIVSDVKMVVEKLIFWFQKMEKFLDKHKISLYDIIGAFIAFKVALVALSLVMGGVGKLFSGLMLAKAAKSAKDVGSVVGKGSKLGGFLASSGQILSLGFAFLMLGAGVAVAALGLAQLVKAFRDLNPEQTQSALIAMGVAVLGFFALIALGAKLASKPMLFFGGAVALIGAGIAVTMVSFSVFIKTLTGALPTLAKYVGVIGQLSMAFGGLAIALGALGLVGYFASAPLIMLAAGVAAMAAALHVVPEYARPSVAKVIDKSANVFEVATSLIAGSPGAPAAASPAGTTVGFGEGGGATGGSGFSTEKYNITLMLDGKEFARAVNAVRNG